MSRTAYGLFALAVVVTLSPQAKAQTAPAASDVTRTVVVSADGKQIGALLGPNQVFIDFPDGEAVIEFDNQQYLRFPSTYQGNFPIVRKYEGKACSGQAYGRPLQTPPLGGISSTANRDAGFTLAGNIFYAARDLVNATTNSYSENRSAGEKCMGRGAGPETATYNPVKSHDLPAFKLPLGISVVPVNTSDASAPAAQAQRSRIGVYDSAGAYIGNLLSEDTVWVRFNNGDAVLKTDPSGALLDAGDFFGGLSLEDTPVYYWTKADCSGPAYLRADTLPTKGYYIKGSGMVQYPKKPVKTIVALASTWLLGGICQKEDSLKLLVGEQAQASLTFKPPMTIK
jgi:hypothetical protein